MLSRIRFFATICLLSLVVVGCGGGGDSGGPDGTTGGGDTSAATSAETSAATSVTEPPSDGGTAAGVCELVTADELAVIFNVSSVKTSVIPGPPDNCIVESDTGDPLSAWSLTTAQASAVYDAFTSGPGTIEVPGIGDKAAIVENTGLLVLKGDSLVVISISGGADFSEDEAIEASKQIGTFAAGRM